MTPSERHDADPLSPEQIEMNAHQGKQCSRRDILDKAAELQQRLAPKGYCLLFFGEVVKDLDSVLSGSQPIDTGMARLPAEVPASHTALMQEWLVGQWGFGLITGICSHKVKCDDPCETYFKFQPYSRETAFASLSKVLRKSMAYGHSLMSREKANRLAHQYMDLFHLDCACFYGNWALEADGTICHPMAGALPYRMEVPSREEWLYQFVLVGLQPGFIAAAACCDDE